MSSPQRFPKNMKEAGGKVPRELNRTSKFVATEQQLNYPTYESDDVLFVQVTPTDRLWEKIHQSDGIEHHPGKIIHNEMETGTQQTSDDKKYELGQHHADTSTTVPDNGNDMARNKNNSFEQLFTINTPTQWNMNPKGPHNLLRNLHGEEQMYSGDQLEVHNSNVRFTDTREDKVTSNKYSYDANHRTGQSEGRMQTVEISSQQIRRSSDLSFPLGPLAEEDLGEFLMMTQEEYENINRLIDESFDELSKSVLEFTKADQALLAAIETENSESSLTKYSHQASLSGDSLQATLVPTAQDPQIQNIDYLQETDTIYYPLQHGAGCPGLPENQPVPSHHSPEKSATMSYPLEAMVGSTTMKDGTANYHPTYYQEGSLSPMCADQPSPMNHNGQITGHYQPSAPLSSPATHRSIPDLDFQILSASPNVAEAAQNTFEHGPLYNKSENGGYNGAVPFQANDIWAYPTPPYDSYTPAESPRPDPAMTHYAENNFGAGGELQQTYYHPTNAEKSVLHGTKNGVPSKNCERDQNGKSVPRSKKRPDWATRPDAARPRVSMTEEEYQWLRPGKPARDIFANSRRKADDKRMREEAMADAMERAGKPRPKPKMPMPIKGGVHIEEWEKERLNEYRKSRGMSGRSLFMAKPQTHGKRKAREVAEPDPQQEPKKQRLSENRDHGFSKMNGVNEDMSGGESRNERRAPLSTHAWPVQNRMDPQLQPPRQPQMFEPTVSPWNGLDPAHSLVGNGVSGTVSWLPDSTDPSSRGQEILQDFNNLIDPRLLSQAQFPHLEE
ncbi:predicted protein [Sclerotinia sclerotiorum 1980 UF-70]|uniref:Uncharacterized protein n=2 Tax=Sclerotinia sclerotiorum (strain ATCC 18683 / 1980 / Ss-1) TaxID=665079 RepID=A7EVC7_SCLS1|nr:predicted protein [Sclerotinia sclerotiorum 1980 UF-70]APA15840.1 hypothetical protein sscle_15g106100 [Sclerotinia sclerotiorum 1980 UF-70]EDN93419.1 predicted protein [Sclerotinia sclerotiorum 1980 UF-70]